VPALDGLLRALTLEPTDRDRYRAGNLDDGHAVVFGGQLLGQSIVAALAGQGGKTVKTLHTIFARAASHEKPLEISVERMHEGRTFSSSAVSIEQGGRLCARSLVLLSADEPDFIRHAEPAPSVPGPDDCKPLGEASGAWQVRAAPGVDVDDPSLVGPPELDVWTRFVGAPEGRRCGRTPAWGRRRPIARCRRASSATR
jgi:acyl-CoA thioesterase